MLEIMPDPIDGLLETAEAGNGEDAGVDRDNDLGHSLEHVYGEKRELWRGVDDAHGIIVLDGA